MIYWEASLNTDVSSSSPRYITERNCTRFYSACHGKESSHLHNINSVLMYIS